MIWDLTTEPEFQKKLDWIDKFVRGEVEPPGYVPNSPCEVRDPKRTKLRMIEREVAAQ